MAGPAEHHQTQLHWHGARAVPKFWRIIMSVVRVVLDNVDPDDPDRLLIEMELDNDRRPQSQTAFFGVCGSLTDPSYRYPFLMMSDGEIDFGSGYDDPSERFWHLRWRGGIAVGDRATVSAAEKEYGYVIQKVEPVG
jgi:hypothetical protein